MALLVSAHPLELYVHDCYWPRVAERPHQTEPRKANASAQDQEEQQQQQQGDVVPMSLLEDPRVSLTATHLLQGGGAVGGGGGGACHPHYEVGLFLLLLLLSLRLRPLLPQPSRCFRCVSHTFFRPAAAPLFRYLFCEYMVLLGMG